MILDTMIMIKVIITYQLFAVAKCSDYPVLSGKWESSDSATTFATANHLT